MNKTVRYILSLLLYGNDTALDRIAYVSAPDPNSPYEITIIGQGLEQSLHYPDLSQPKVEQLPNGHYIICTDLVYNTFFFISRAEELLNSTRDEYGRFLARFSQLSTNDWQIPLIDEYSRLVLKLLHLPLPKSDFSAVHLTHDIDILTCYRHLRGALGGIYRGHAKDVLEAWRDIHQDPAYTFPWMIAQDTQCSSRLPQCSVIYFVKDTPGKGIDYPQYNLQGKDWRTTAQLLQISHAQLGLHSSAYATSPLPTAQFHRSHFLSCSIQRMQQLIEAGITDDFTMGFADHIGFRLQTTRAVQWINPLTRCLTPLTLHPLTIMDCTLSNPQYMHLTEDEAYFCATKLIDKVREHHGEVNLLWHNTVFTTDYHRSLYPKILALL